MMREAGEEKPVSQARLMLHGCVTSRCARPTGGRHGRTTRAPVQRRRAQSGDCYSELPRIPIPRTRVNKGIKRVGATMPWPFLA